MIPTAAPSGKGVMEVSNNGYGEIAECPDGTGCFSSEYAKRILFTG